MHKDRPIGESPPRLGTRRKVPNNWHLVCAALGLACGSLFCGCKATVQEIRGKSSFGPEFRHQGEKNTSEIRYDTRQNIDLKWDNGWTTGLTYRRRDIDHGTGDNENLFLFEVGYPIWKAPKKPEKTAERIDALERELADLKARVAAGPAQPETPSVVSAGTQP